MFLPLVALLVAQIAPELVTPERLFLPAEGRVELSAAGGFSAQTRAPTGALFSQGYLATNLNLRAEVGVASFLLVDLFVPLVDGQFLAGSTASLIRFGDPTLALRGGAALGPIELLPFVELTVPTSGRVLIGQPSGLEGAYGTGALAATGSQTALLGLTIAHHRSYGPVGLSLSGRGYYRLRFDDYANGSGFDLRGRALLFDHLLAGLYVAGLFSNGGLGQALISASRLGDGASWVDLGGVLGLQFEHWLEAVVSVGEPLWFQSSARLLQVQLVIAAHAVPSW